MTKSIEIKKGNVRWYYRIVDSNKNILLTSQKYFSKSNAKRAAFRLSVATNIPLTNYPT